MKPDLSVVLLEENTVGQDRMDMDIQVQSRPKSLNEGDGTAQGSRDALLPGAATLPGEQRAQKQPQHEADELGTPRQKEAQALGKGEDPLSHREGREHAVAKVRRRVGHAPCTAGRTHAAILAGKSDEQLVAASRTANAGEAVAENAAAQISLKLGADEGGDVAAGIALGRVGQKRGEVCAHDAVQQRLFRLSTLIAEGRSGRAVCLRPGFRCRSEHRSVPITSHANLTFRRRAVESDSDRSWFCPVHRTTSGTPASTLGCLDCLRCRPSDQASTQAV